MRKRPRSRRCPAQAANMGPPSLLPAFFLRRGLTCLAPLLVVLLLIVAYAASSRFVAKQVMKRTPDLPAPVPLPDSIHPTLNQDVYTFEVVNEYNHDPEAFTQGLVYAENDTFYESTGMYGMSSVRKVHIQSGKVLQLHKMEGKYFGEGLTLWNHRLFQVAWRITSGFIYDMDSLSLLGSFKHPMTDGWGLTTDGSVIYGSDGTSTIYVMQPATFKEERRLVVRDQNKEIFQLNELEYIDGELWANVWLTDCIVRISPENGRVLGWILLHALRSNLLAHGNKHIDVLNGIAWDGDQKRLFVTGKYWPKLYEIKVHPHSDNFKDHEHIWKRCQVH